jgi:hypothetical protein
MSLGALRIRDDCAKALPMPILTVPIVDDDLVFLTACYEPPSLSDAQTGSVKNSRHGEATHRAHLEENHA